MSELSTDEYEGSTLAPLGRPVPDELSVEFSDIESERLFNQLRSQMFARDEELTIGRYRLVRRLGAGAMGEVHLAHDTELDRPLAIKFVHAHLAQLRFAEALRQEARALARLAHANVVHIYEVGEFRGRVFLAMEYIRGQSLREWIREQSPSWEQVLAAYLEAARGLAAAHGAGVVHRDFKPDNVLRGTDGRVAVADFGLAALDRVPVTIDEYPGATQPGIRGATQTQTDALHSATVKGTPAYMPPEQFRGESDARSDQFALCVALCEGLWGRRPLPSRPLDELLAGGSDWTLTPPPKRSGVPSWLWPILRRGLALEPEARWPSVDALIAAIEGRRRRGRTRLWVLGVGAALVSVGALSAAAGVWWSQPLEDCTSFESALDGTWDGGRRDQLTQTLDAAKPWVQRSGARAMDALDVWRERWLASRAQLCEARAGGDPVILARHDSCLERQRRAVQVTVDLLIASEPQQLREIGAAVQGLADPLACEAEAQRSGPPLPPPEIAARVEELRDELLLAEAERATARYEAALARVDALEVRARALGHAPLMAEIASLRGYISISSQQIEAAYEQLELAADLAVGARHDRVVVDSWLRMAKRAAYEPEPERARRWLRRAQAAATRVGTDALTEARLAAVRGNIARRDQRYDEAAADLERAQAAFLELGELRHASYASTDLGDVRIQLGQHERALAELELALELRERVFGAGHPELAWAAYNFAQIAEGQTEFARTQLQRAVNIWSASESQRPLDLGRAQFGLAQLELEAGDFERSLELAEAAALTFEDTLGPADVAHAEAAMLIGAANYFLGRAEPSVGAYRRGVAGYAEAYGDGDVYVAFFRVALAWSLLAAGDLDEARATFTRGRSVIEAELGAGTEDSVDVNLGLVAVDLAAGEPERASERLAQFGAVPEEEMNQLSFALLRGLAGLRSDRRDAQARAALREAGELARSIGGGEATAAVLLASVNADASEHELVLGSH